jgi:superfamily II DNA or RNA helicase
VNTLILVHRQQLLDQWKARLAIFLGLAAKSIGQVGGGTAKRSGCVDIAILQSAYDKDGVKDFVAEYGQVNNLTCCQLHGITSFAG